MAVVTINAVAVMTAEAHSGVIRPVAVMIMALPGVMLMTAARNAAMTGTAVVPLTVSVAIAGIVHLPTASSVVPVWTHLGRNRSLLLWLRSPRRSCRRTPR